MAKIAPLIIAAVGATGLTAALITIAVNVVMNFAMSAIMSAFTSKPKSPNLSPFVARQTDLTSMIRQPVTTWRMAFGEALMSGPLTYYEATDNNKYHHLVIVLSHREVEAIKAVYFDDEPIYDADLDGSGNVTSGKYSGKARIKKHLGGAGQTADSDLIAEVAALDSNFVGVDCAYIYVRIQTDRDLFPGVIPGNIKAWVQGMKVLDPRDASTAWNPNPALLIHDYLTDTTVGRRVAAADVLDSATNTAADICDEMVTTKTVSHDVLTVDVSGDFLDLDQNRLRFFTGDRVRGTTTGTLPAGLALATDYYVIHRHELISTSQKPSIKLATTYANAIAAVAIDITDGGSGTHTITKNAEPRYTAHGVIDTSRRPGDILEEMRWSMAGHIPMNGPQWTILAGAYVAPSLTFDDGDLRGGIQRKGRHPRFSRFNAVKGTFVTHLNAAQPTDYPIITSSTHQTNDGGDRIFHELDLPLTNRAQTAQRIATIALKRHRLEQLYNGRWGLTAFQAMAGENVGITNDRRSFSNKAFFVDSMGFSIDVRGNDIELYVNMALVETSSDVYVFDEAADEVIVEPSPIQNPLDPTAVTNPTGLTLTSGTAELDRRIDGTIFSRIKVAWTAPLDEFVTQGGKIEIEFKKNADGTWLPHRFVDGEKTEDFILDVQDGVAYDVRIRSVNQLGIRNTSFVSELNHTVAGKTADPSTVTGFTVAQNGDVVNIRYDAVADADLAGYDVRYATRTDALEFIDATPIGPELVAKGTIITTALIPPGDLTFYIKAVDTSGNRSATAATVDAVISQTNDVIIETEHSPDWLFANRSNFVDHYTGVLTPTSANADATGANVFSSFVDNPETTCIFEAPEQDVGFDSTVRVWANIDSALGPGETAGTANPALEIDYRLDAGAYGGFLPWTAGNVTGRFFKFRLVLTPADGNAKITGFKTVIDLKERTEGDGAVVIAPGGTAITFAARFHIAPRVAVTNALASALIPGFTSVTVTGFTAHVFNTSGADVGGTINWEATGV